MVRQNLIAQLILPVALSAILLGHAPPVAGNEAPDESQIAPLVKDLGVAQEDISKDLAVLQSRPHIAVKLLVLQLHTIPRKMYYEQNKSKDVRHVIGCLRALHYLTGASFTATSAIKLSDDEKQFLDFRLQMHDENPGHQLHFFGVWMSRNADCFAPEDAQRKIIQQWVQWQDTNGESFEPPHSGDPAKFMDEWYWFG
jgi:hypothetical protein